MLSRVSASGNWQCGLIWYYRLDLADVGPVSLSKRAIPQCLSANKRHLAAATVSGCARRTTSLS